MSSELELLGARKQLLVARVSLQRLRAAHDVEALAQSLRGPGPMGLVARRPVLSLLVAGTLFALSRGRIGQATRWAGVAVALLRVVRGFAARSARSPDQSS